MTNFGTINYAIRIKEDINPTMFSQLSYKGMELLEVTSGEIYKTILLNKKDSIIQNKLFKNHETDLKYVEIHENPKEQMLVSLILKGIINVADILLVDGKYFSAVLDVNDIGEKSIYHFNADNYILWLLISDEDHYTDLNLERNDEMSKYYFYDFGECCFGGGCLKGKGKGFMKRVVNNIEDDDTNDGLYLISYMESLIEKLYLRFSTKDGYKYFILLLKVSGIEMSVGETYWHTFIHNLGQLKHRVKILEEKGYGINYIMGTSEK